MALRPYNILGAPEDATDVLGTLQGYTATATAAGTTTLTDASTALQVFTGTTTQTVELPVTSTIVVGAQYTIANKSTGAVTVNASDGSLVATVAASSTSRVSCNSVAGTTNAAWTLLPVAAGGASITPATLMPVTGEVMSTNTGGGVTGTINGIADRMDIYPFTARRDVTVTALQMNITTAVGSAQGKIVVYASDSNGRPTTLIYESATPLDFSSTGVKTSTVSLSFTSGSTYWFGLRSSSTATFSSWATGTTPHINGGAAVTSARTILRRSVTFATAAPDPWVFASSEINAQQGCAIWLVVA